MSVRALLEAVHSLDQGANPGEQFSALLALLERAGWRLVPRLRARGSRWHPLRDRPAPDHDQQDQNRRDEPDPRG